MRSSQSRSPSSSSSDDSSPDKESSGKVDVIIKKRKTGNGEKKVKQSQVSVSGRLRKAVTERILVSIKKNSIFAKEDKDFKYLAISIEKEIYIKNHLIFSKYNEEVEKILVLFRELAKYPYISKNIVRRNYSIEIFWKLIEHSNKLPKFELQAIEKEKEKQAVSVKSNNKTQAQATDNIQNQLYIFQYNPLEVTSIRHIYTYKFI